VSTSRAEVAEGLARVLGGVDVVDLVQLSGGASRETWSFGARAADGRQEPLILQRQRPGSERDMAVEVAVLQVARQAGVPVAEVVASGSDDDGLAAAYMVVRRVAGETIARKILRDEQYSAARAALPRQLGRALASLHRIPIDAVPALLLVDQVQQYREVLDLSGQPHPTFELAFRWLAERRPPPGGQAIVHGDFRLGNVIVDEHGLAAVLDWELAHLGDPMEDLGWLCVKAWRFGGRAPVAGVGEYDDLFDAYSEAADRPVDPEVVRWWEVLGTLKWGIMCIMQASAHLSGASRSHELAAIGRRVCENEHDLLALMG
jgi:aminoglycoside phosphotransferase (APT) family kinase protein